MKKVLKTTSLFILSSIIVLAFLYITAFISGKPEIGKNYSLELYNHKQEIFYAAVNKKSGEWVSLDDVSEDFLNAIIDIEDQHFYSHRGFDYVGIARAIIINLKDRELSQGASTISQQYVKNLFLTNEKTWERKIKEAWLTMQVEMHYSKEEILEGYINTTYFGAGIYGIQNASQHFFSKNASDLNLQEASLLAGIVNGPELYSPTRNKELVRERQNLVLKAMYQNHHISEFEYQNALQQETPLVLNQEESENQTLGYFKDQVLSELEELGFDEEDCLKDGLKVYTTLDEDLQLEISKSLSRHFQEDDEIQAAIVVVKPNDGAILAMSGGRDYHISQYNRAVLAKRQMASTVKPVLYYDALLNGFNPVTKFVSEKTTFRLANDKTYAPSNYNDLYPNKEITLIDALATSDNIYAVKTHLFLGEEILANRLQSFGYDDAIALPSLALGCVETSPLMLANMYNTFASLGNYYEDYCIERIENQNGQILYQHTSQPKKMLSEDICLVLNQMLTATFDPNLMDVTTPTMIEYRSESTFAAKTGTSDWDSWTMAYNPNMVIGIWLGFDDNQPLGEKYKFKGREIFYDISQLDKSKQWYEPSKNVIAMPIDPLTGDFSINGSIYWFYQPIKKKYSYL